MTTTFQTAPDTTFTCSSRQDLPHLASTCEYWQHPSGMVHVHLAAEDTHLAAAIAVRTPPTNDSGLPHILEHLALCGSKQFPVRDPFFLMLRRSLQTFMNAMTYPDYTCYPFSTCNKQDFYNLFSIYSDAVFAPNLDRRDFDQEGWRLEPDAEGNPQLAGIVFNEMKGAMGDSDAQCEQALTKYLLSDTCYAVNSGGDPQAIPDLSYDDLVAFHRRHYTPSNAILVTYGNIPAREIQQHLGRHLESKTTVPATLPPLVQHTVMHRGERLSVPVPCAEDSDTARLDASLLGRYYLLGDHRDPEVKLKAQFVDILLTDHAGSPLRQTFEKSSIARSASGCGLISGYRNGVFAIELTGVEKPELFEDTLQKSFCAALDAALSEEAIAGALHRLELQSRRLESDAYGKGLLLALNVVRSWNLGAEPALQLDVPQHLGAITEWAQNPGAIREWIATNIVNNDNWLELVADPDPDWSDKLAQWQDIRAQELAATSSDPTAFQAAAQALKERQAEVDDESCLPTLRRHDIATSMPPIDGNWDNENTPSIFHNTAGTNGLAAITLIQQLPTLSVQELELLPYLSGVLARLGTGDRDYQQQAARLQLVCEQCSSSYRLFRRPGSNDINATFSLHISGLERNTGVMAAELQRVLMHQRFDEHDRHNDLLSQRLDRLGRSMIDRGHRLAGAAAAAAVDDLAAWHDYLGGAAMMGDVRQKVEGVAAAELGATLQELWHKLAAGSWQLAVVGSDANTAPLLDHLNDFVHPAATLAAAQPLLEPGRDLRGIALPQAICFNAQAWSLNNDISLEKLGQWQVALQALRDRVLHTKIREQGSAYGSMAGVSGRCVRLISYRDPRLDGTFADYREAIETMANNTWNDDIIEQAVLGVMADFDQPLAAISHASRAFHWWSQGLTAADINTQRQAILATTSDDIRNLGQSLHGAKSAVASAADKKSLNDSARDWIIESW